MSFPGGLLVENPFASVGDEGSIPGLGWSLGEENGNPLQYSCLGDPMDRGACWAAVPGVAKTQTLLRFNNNKQALPTNILLFVSINLAMQGTLYRWKQNLSPFVTHLFHLA